MNDQNHFYPFVTAKKKVKTLKDHACTFSGVKIFKGYDVESATVNTEENGKRSKLRVYMCGKCIECLHLLQVRENQG